MREYGVLEALGRDSQGDDEVMSVKGDERIDGLNIRKLVAEMIIKSGGGHVGASFSIADILAVLYRDVLKYDPQNPELKSRDRFVLSKGHSGLALYAVLALAEFFDSKEILGFGKEESVFMNHPDSHRIPGVEMSTGSLGHGFPLAVGMALAGKKQKASWKVFTILGDGECHEGSVWEAAMFASSYKLDNIIAIIDRNRMGNDGMIDEGVNLDDLAEKWRAFGWNVIECDGHDEDALSRILTSIAKSPVKRKPTVLIAHTVKGQGLRADLAGAVGCHYIKGQQKELIADFDFMIEGYESGNE